MKNKLNKFLLVASALALFTSCNDDDTLEGVRNSKPTLTVDQTSVAVTEGDVITFTVTIDRPVSNAVDYRVELDGGTGSFRDFTSNGEETTIDEGGFGQGKIGYKLVFPALATSATFTITPVKDVLVEGTETLRLRLNSSGNMLAVIAPDSQYIDITVADYVSNEFQIDLDWSGSTTNIHGTISPGQFADSDGDLHDFCDLDMDLEVYDGAFNLVATSYSSCPESITIPADAPDDTYFIVPSFWSANGLENSNRVQIPLMLSCAKPGVFVDVLDMTSVFNTEVGGNEEGNPDAYQVVRVVQKVGTTYTLMDIDGNVLATGRYAGLANAIRAQRRH